MIAAGVALLATMFIIVVGLLIAARRRPDAWIAAAAAEVVAGPVTALYGLLTASLAFAVIGTLLTALGLLSVAIHDTE